MLDLQGLADDLCQQLHRSVAVDNKHVEVIAASAQIGAIDEVRSDAILNRRTRPDIVDYVRSLRVPESPGPVEVPPHPTLKTLPRWCFPLRNRGRLLGYLWVINEPRLTPDEFELAIQYAERMVGILARSSEEADSILKQSVQLTNELLTEGHRDALSTASRTGMLLSLGRATAWSLVLTHERETHRSVTTVELLELLSDLLATTRPGSFIGAPIEDRLVLVNRKPSDRSEDTSLTTAVGLSCRRLKLSLKAVGRAKLVEGVDPREALDRANFTATVARWDEGSGVREWERLGSWALLKGREWSMELIGTISPSVHTLIEHGKPNLLHTLLAYLENRGNASATCKTLHLHRATLYYRLGRVKEVAGEAVLTSGWEQTSAHLALRVWQARRQALSAGMGVPGA